MPTVREALNNGNPNSVDHCLQMAGAGEALALIARTVRATVTAHKIVLPEKAKAARIQSAYGMGTTSGYKTPLPLPGTTPATTEVAINAQGDIVFATADAITSAVVVYSSVEGEVFEDTIDIATNLGTLLGSRRASILLSATRLAGGAVGASTPVARPTTPTAGNAAISATDDSKIAFPAADAVTRATVRYLAVPGVGVTQRKSVGEALEQTVGGV
jgi:hypothetical protein